MRQTSVRKDPKQRLSAVLILFLITFFCMTAALSAQGVDQRLQGVWELDSVELKTSGASQRYQVNTILQNPAIKALVGSVLDNRYLTILFYQNSVELGINGTMNENVKGTCSAANGRLTVSLYNETSQTYDYRVAGERLYLSYTLQGRQLSLIFKSNTKF
jgi:hypothetical protein